MEMIDIILLNMLYTSTHSDHEREDKKYILLLLIKALLTVYIL